MNRRDPFRLLVSAAESKPGVRLISWRWPGGGFQKQIDTAEVSSITQQAERIMARQRAGFPIKKEVEALGVNLGQLLVGTSNATPLLEMLDRHHDRFFLCLITGTDPALARLAWEALTVPGTDSPLIFNSHIRGRVEFARYYDLTAEPAGRRVSDKCLAAWSCAKREELMVEEEVEELRARLVRYPSLNFRWLLNPDLNQLAAGLRRECSLFLYAGHGELNDGTYRIELESGLHDVNLLIDSLRVSRAEMLIFDSCDSGLGDSTFGLPAVFDCLPSARCLLGMQGPMNDVVSSWHMPNFIDRLFLGEPVWSCVNSLRIMLYDLSSDSWLQPVMHLKSGYEPINPRREENEYLEELLVR